jgi:alkylation response protein AidB-like acyl-CoA dehydrogenase
MVDFADSPEEADFRAEVRQTLAAHAPKGRRGGGRGGYGADGLSEEARREQEQWRKALIERRWIAPHWPREYGGAGLSVKDQFILSQELAEAGTWNISGLGTMMFGPTLIVHGSEEQKQEHLPKILDDSYLWCQGWSEPGAGSDLASLQTRAIRDGDEYVINGQKIWTSLAHRADGMYFIARTDPDAPKHRGISFFWMSMKLPGITVQPLVNMANQHSFNEVFFEDVRIPADHLIGEENRGWYHATTLLDYERSGIGNSVGTRRQFERTLKMAKELPREQSMLTRNPQLRLAFADRIVDAEVGMLFSFRITTLQANGQIPNYEASVAKLFNSEMTQRIAALNIRLFGLYGSLMDPDREEAERGAAARGYLQAVASTIGGGTSEIQRNIIATRGLGLPRG